MLDHHGALKLALVGNLFLMVVKLAAGVLSGSAALLADGVHSFTDVLSTVAAGVGSWIGGAPPDEDHPYGHGGAENVAAVVVAGIMLATAGALFQRGAGLLAAGTLVPPESMAAWVAGATCLVKEALHRQAAREAVRTRSPSIDALSKDHRSDALSSVAALVGIEAARHGYPAMDPMASLVIAAFILKLGWETLVENLHVLMDREPETPELKAGLLARAGADPEVAALRNIRVHQVGAVLHLQIDLLVAPTMTVQAAHEVAHRVEGWAKELDRRVASAQVHVEPAEAPGAPG